MCDNKVDDVVPTRYSYKSIERECGGTGHDGHRLLCDECQRKKDEGTLPKTFGEMYDCEEPMDEDPPVGPIEEVYFSDRRSE